MREDLEEEQAGGHVDWVMSATTPCNKMEKMKKQQSTYLPSLNEKDWARRESGPTLKAENSTQNNQIDNNKEKK